MDQTTPRPCPADRRPRRRLVLWPTLAIALLLSSGHLAAAAYKCTDADGRGSFSDRPCEAGDTATTIELDVCSVPESDLEDRGESTDRTRKVLDALREEREAKESRQAELAAERRARQEEACNRRRDLLTKLELREWDAQGYTIYALEREDGSIATEAEKQAEVRELKAYIARHCD